MPPVAEMQHDPEVAGEEPSGLEVERAARVLVNGDDELTNAWDMLNGFNVDADDGNWGINVYCEVVIMLTSHLEAQNHK